jgi:hypothetical protein
VLLDRRAVLAGREQGAKASPTVVCLAISILRRPLYHPDKVRSLGREGVTVRGSGRVIDRSSRRRPTDAVASDDGSELCPGLTKYSCVPRKSCV